VGGRSRKEKNKQKTGITKPSKVSLALVRGNTVESTRRKRRYQRKQEREKEKGINSWLLYERIPQEIIQLFSGGGREITGGFEEKEMRITKARKNNPSSTGDLGL